MEKTTARTENEILQDLSNNPQVSTQLVSEIVEKFNELKKLRQKYEDLRDLYRRRYAP